jgi:hypothetical protein
MNEREKVLASMVGGVAGLIVLIVGARQLIVMPMREIDKRAAGVREKLEKVKNERRAFFTAEDKLKRVARRTFADSIEEAGSVSSEMLTRQIAAAGLRESDFTRLPLGSRKLRGASEIGWSIQGVGPLKNVVDLLFILDSSPWLHRTENLTMTAAEAPGVVRIRLSYLTLVIEPAPEVTRTSLAAQLALDSPERRVLDGMVLRDILRPYIKEPPSPPAQKAVAAAPGSPPGPENFRIVSLSEWLGRPEIHVRDLAAQKTARYKPGDEVAGGVAVMVDYRPMPAPGNSLLQSDSRLILRIDKDYWAIERGKTFADKRKLTRSELPPQLAQEK